MNGRAKRAMVGATAVVSLAWLTALGCSSSKSSAPPDPGGRPLCPNTVQLANGAKCTVDRYVCGIGFPCSDPPISQQALCTCTGGTYHCVDQSTPDRVIDPGTDPQCKSNGGPNDSQCPASESGTDFAPCQTAGLICFYKGIVCPENGGAANTDICQCVGDQKGGLAYRCERQFCNPTSDAAPPPPPPPEAGPPPADGGAG